ncbi:hypothetical protein HDE_07901 [Halotydeus destructor]|nr:hypothetical protein HDE_07901 [Halotydeus destructor]
MGTNVRYCISQGAPVELLLSYLLNMPAYLDLLLMFNGIPLSHPSGREKLIQAMCLTLNMAYSLVQLVEKFNILVRSNFGNAYATVCVFKYLTFSVGRVWFIGQRRQLCEIADSIRNFKIINTKSMRILERRYLMGWIFGVVCFMVVMTTFWWRIGTTLVVQYIIGGLCDRKKVGAIPSVIVAATGDILNASSNSWPICFIAINMIHLACLSEVCKSLINNLLYQIERQHVDLQYCRSRWMYFTRAKVQLNTVMAPHLFFLIIHLFSEIVSMSAAFKMGLTKNSAVFIKAILCYEVGMCVINFSSLGLLIALNHRWNTEARANLDNVTETFYRTMSRNFGDSSKNQRLAEFLDSLRIDTRNSISLFSFSEIDMNFIVQFGAILVPIGTLMNQVYEAKQDTRTH